MEGVEGVRLRMLLNFEADHTGKTCHCTTSNGVALSPGGSNSSYRGEAVTAAIEALQHTPEKMGKTICCATSRPFAHSGEDGQDPLLCNVTSIRTLRRRWARPSAVQRHVHSHINKLNFMS
eukprot:366458-Chlamydomonas_euryale.AAC.17